MSSKIHFTPGPSQLFYSVPFHLKNALSQDIPTISHRSKSFELLFSETRELLSEVLELPKGYEIFFTASATEIWERIYQNLVESSSHHFVNGSFSKKFYQTGQQLGFNPSSVIGKPRTEFDNFDVNENPELISVTVNETSTGYAFDADHIVQLRNKNPNAIISADTVSAVPSIKFDFSQIDTAYFSVQKCFGLPAGLGVWIVNQKCIEKAAKKQIRASIGSYHNLLELKKFGDKDQTPETPNVLSIYLLKSVLRDMLDRGLNQIRNDTIYKSSLIYNICHDLPEVSPNIIPKKNQSKTVCVLEINGDNNGLIEELGSKKMVVGKGYGDKSESQIRIANFPTHSREHFELLTDSLTNYFNK